MIPAQFDYVRVATVDEAVAALAEREEAKVLGGGQSLIPLLRLRVIDVGTIIGILTTGNVDARQALQAVVEGKP